MKSNFLSRKRQGFTLIELLVVIGILAALAGVAYPTYNAISASAKRTAAEKVCTDIVTAVERYAQDNNQLLPYDSDRVRPDANDQIYLESAEGKDARLIEILTNRETGDRDRLNKAREVYLRSDEKTSEGPKSDGLFVDEATGEVSLYDAWGKPYYIILCEEQEGCVDPFSPKRKRYRGKHCFVYSTGPDGEGAASEYVAAAKGSKKGGKGNKKGNKKQQQQAAQTALEEMADAIEDNVYSWKKKS